MNEKEWLRILNQAAALKTTFRHCQTSGSRRESVAEHSWRTALMAMLLSGEPEFQTLDINRIIRMCLIHDLGEAFTGDIPTFDKTGADAQKEDTLLTGWVRTFPAPLREEWLALLEEMSQQETAEARTYKALDKLEAVISHNESDIRTWLPLEYELQLTYGQENVRFSDFLTRLKQCIDETTRQKIRDSQSGCPGVSPDSVCAPPTAAARPDA